MKRITALAVFITCFIMGLPGYAQEMPPGNVIVNTGCLINEGHTFAEAVEVARFVDYDREDAPNIMFFRQPIAGGNAPQNGLLRVVYWTDMAHWVRGSAGRSAPSGASAHLNEIMTCNNATRSFFTNRNVGQGNAYNGGENQQSLVASRLCEIRPGNTIADVYAGLTNLNENNRPPGDTTLMQLSHRFLGPSEGTGMGSRITIRLIGENAAGLAARLDASAKATGTPDDAPVMNCQDRSLWSSHVVHWGI